MKGNNINIRNLKLAGFEYDYGWVVRSDNKTVRVDIIDGEVVSVKTMTAVYFCDNGVRYHQTEYPNVKTIEELKTLCYFFGVEK